MIVAETHGAAASRIFLTPLSLAVVSIRPVLEPSDRREYWNLKTE